MPDTNFTVKSNRFDKILSLIFGAVITIHLLLTMSTSGDSLSGWRMIGLAIFTLFYFCIFLAVSIAIWMFRIDVNGTEIHARSKWGKKCAFRCADIRRVTCKRHRDTKHGTSYYLALATEHGEFEISHTMDGFETMAGYILRMHMAGQIRFTAVSQSCRQALQYYENGGHLRKKGKRHDPDTVR